MVTILGIEIDDLNKNELIETIVNSINQINKCVISNVNIYAMNLSYENRWYRDFLNNSFINFCDGFGVSLGAKILGSNIKNRNTPPDWIPNLSAECSKNKITLGFIGSNPGIVENTTEILKQKSPDLKVTFTHHGYFNKTPGHPENETVIKQINQAHPDILMVGFGMPLQEKWIMENFDRLDVKVILPVGAAFDYISGNVRRAPRWMTDHGLEWLGRLIIEPRRLWKRYIIGIPLFFFRVFKQKLGLLKFPD